ncbi:unnamed protein product [Mycena citricolor]|uniref:NADP-dependent oxidoreductase domain-containing protein n=1 Tax=Mycena citricolor TaxID=2018698 RepID=A0AAD2JVT9_9AGAR|nr:unnamed protein product [Mycena citricolor]
MKYVRLGNSGLKVSRIILGCMSYGSPEWQKWVLEEEESLKHIKTAYDAGINTFDTANTYSNGASEVILGKAIKQFNLPRDEIVVMTKESEIFASQGAFIILRLALLQVFFPCGRKPSDLAAYLPNFDEGGYVNQHGLSRKHIFDSVKHSLERLQLDYIDVLQCHRFDKDTPIEETVRALECSILAPNKIQMQALHDVVKAGYVRYIGMSSCWAWQFSIMQNYAIQNNLTPFISMQNHYSMVYREEEREMMPTLKHFKVGCIPWSPLARGLLTRPISEQSKRGSLDMTISSYHSEPTTKIVNRVEEIAKKKGKTMAQIALAWVLAKDAVTAPIVGSTSLNNLGELFAATEIELSKEEVEYLDEPYQPGKVIGHS